MFLINSSKKNESLFNFCFCLPDGPASKMASGQYTLGVYEIRVDNYKTLKVALGEIVTSLTHSRKDKVYSIDLHLSGKGVF